MRYLLLLVLLASCAPTSQKIEGEVYVVTEGRETVRLAGSQVSAYPLADFEKLLVEKGTSNPDVYSYLTPLPPLVEKVTTDSEGKFSMTLPKGEYALLAVEHRDVGGRKEFYQWLVKAQPKTVLTNNNLAGRGDSLLPKRFALP